jgi:hypothetical protein
MHTSVTPRFSRLGQHGQPELRALAAVTGPQPEDVAFPGHGDADDDVDRLVADLAIADLDHDRVDEDHRVDRVEGPVGPGRHLLDHLVGDLGDCLLRHRGAVHLREVGRDLPGGQPPGGERQHDLVDPVQPALALLHDLRRERRIDVTRDVDLDRADLGQQRLRADPVAGVGMVPPDRVVLVIAQMLGHLFLERSLEDLLGELAQQPVRAHQVDALRPGPRDQLLGHALLIQLGRLLLLRCCHVVQRVSHGLVPLGSDQPVPPFS